MLAPTAALHNTRIILFVIFRQSSSALSFGLLKSCDVSGPTGEMAVAGLRGQQMCCKNQGNNMVGVLETGHMQLLGMACHGPSVSCVCLSPLSLPFSSAK